MAKKPKIYDGQIPFYKENGDQMHYAHESDKYVIWRDNFTFLDTLVVATMCRGRSAAYFEFVRKSNGTAVYVFMTDAIDLMHHMVKGEVTGTFAFCKRGMNFGCKLVAP